MDLYVVLTECNLRVTVTMAMALPDVIPDGLRSFCQVHELPYVDGE